MRARFNGGSGYTFSVSCAMGASPGFALEGQLSGATPKNSQPPCWQQPPFDNSGWQELEKDQPNDRQGANPDLLTDLQNAR
jgi:hypothetical protein